MDHFLIAPLLQATVKNVPAHNDTRLQIIGFAREAIDIVTNTATKINANCRIEFTLGTLHETVRRVDICLCFTHERIVCPSQPDRLLTRYRQ